MKCLKSNPDSIDICSKALKNNEVVIIPTDTVYGFSGIAGATEEKIRMIKGRAENKPFIQLISKKEDLNFITDSKIPEKLLSYWPGPLTIIVKIKNSTETVAVRCPGDKWLRAVIEKCGSPVLSTSVNRSGNPVIGKIDEITREFENEVSLIVDDGDAKSSVPSTIVSFIDNELKLIRQGQIDLDFSDFS